MILDSHIHVGKWAYPHYPVACTVSDINTLLNACGIEGAILMPTDEKNNAELLEEIKRDGKKKYWFFPWVDIRDSSCISFLQKHINSISGLKFHSGLDRIKGGVTDSVYEPFFELASTYRLPVLVHTGRTLEISSYKYALDVAEKYPTLPFILAHLGGDFEQLKIEAPREVKARRIDNVYFDISATREFWTIQMGIREIGAERFLFGSDYPVMHPKMSLESVNALSISGEEKDKVFGKNLLNILGQRSEKQNP